MYVYVSVRACAYLCVRMYLHARACVYMCLLGSIRVCMCVCVCVYVCVFVSMKKVDEKALAQMITNHDYSNSIWLIHQGNTIPVRVFALMKRCYVETALMGGGLLYSAI